MKTAEQMKSLKNFVDKVGINKANGQYFQMLSWFVLSAITRPDIICETNIARVLIFFCVSNLLFLFRFNLSSF